MKKLQTHYYQDDLGKVPFLKWFYKLDRTEQILLRYHLKQMTLGKFGDSEPVGFGVLEKKIASGYRVYYGRRSYEITIILFGGTKRKQQRDIDYSIDLWLICGGLPDAEILKFPRVEH